jgi:protein phosphatase
VYLLHQGSIDKLTRDHSYVQRLIEMDQITPAEASDHPQRSLLYRALGQNDTIEIDTTMRRIPPGAKLLLCSDGLWDQVQDREIREIVYKSRSPQDACTQLIALANARGGIDNVTVILLQMPA